MMSDFVMEHYQIEEPYRSVSMECGATSALGGLDIELQKCCVVNLDIREEVGARYKNTVLEYLPYDGLTLSVYNLSGDNLG